MKKLLDYLPFHFLVCLIVGIVLQSFWADSYISKGTFLLFITILFFLIIILRKTQLFVVFVGLFWVLLGMLSVFQHDDRKAVSYFEKHLEGSKQAVLQVTKVLKPGKYYHKYEAEVIQVDTTVTSGKILLNIKNDSLHTPFLVDDVLIIPSDFKSINTPLNPHQFNYKAYLARQNIYKQAFVDTHRFLKMSKERPTFFGYVHSFRSSIQQKLREQFSKEEYAVINALILGQRHDISKELLEEYSKAGAIHILAVSGLHVGIILLILNFVLKPLERLPQGRTVKLIIVVMILWLFATLAGLSASVVRAVTMFTAVAIGMLSQRKNIVEHSLVFSMLILLLVKPTFLFDVGFQLSYFAVFGIVWVQPVLYSIWKPKFILLDNIWQLTTVSVAAQFGILPLSLFYFHQFPGLFLLSNIVIIPFLGFLLFSGIVVCLLAALNMLPNFLARVYEVVINTMNRFVEWVSFQEEFLLKDISMSFWRMLSFYLLIILGFQCVKQLRVKQVIYFLSSVLLIQSVVFFEKYTTQGQKEFIVFHKSRRTVLGDRMGEELLIVHDLDSTTIAQERLVKDYEVGERVSIHQRQLAKDVFKMNDQLVLMIDSFGVYPKDLKQSILVLRQNPKVNLERLIKELQPKQIVADGSNYKSLVLKWEKTCDSMKVPFWYTGEAGAYALKAKAER